MADDRLRKYVSRFALTWVGAQVLALLLSVSVCGHHDAQLDLWQLLVKGPE